MDEELGLVVSKLSHSYAYGVALDDISISVVRGKIACLLGPSGCGKTTLLRVIAGFEKPKFGEIRINGEVVLDPQRKIAVAPEKRRVGMVFQDCALFPHLTVAENIRFGMDKNDKGGKKWLDMAMAKLDIAQFADELPNTLSGGEQQRVAFLRALAAKPRVLLLDEPFSGLDTKNRATVREATLDLLHDSKMTALMVTHDPEEAMFMADRIFVLGKRGYIVQQGQPAELWLGPKDTYVAELFGSANHLHGVVENGVVRTLVGDFAAPNIYSGTEVDVLIRPDGVGLATPPAGNHSSNTCGNVVSARNMGRFTYVRVAVDSQNGGAILQARLPGVFNLKPKSAVNVLIEKCSVFVFPKDSAAH